MKQSYRLETIKKLETYLHEGEVFYRDTGPVP